MKIIKSTQYFFFLLLTIGFLTACNKEKGSVTPNILRKLDKVTISDGTFRHYTYDALGRRSRVDYKDYYITYNYNGNIVIETFTYFDPTKSGTVYTNTLNSQGLVSKYTYKSGSFTYATDREYDINGRIIKITDKNTTSTSTGSIMSEYFYAYDVDGDLVTFEYRSPLYPTSDHTIQYTIDKNHYNTTGNEFSGFACYGKNAFHVATKAVRTYRNGVKATTDYPITYDAKGYILSQINSTSTNTTTGVTTILNTATYTYK